MKIVILIVNYNSWQATKKMLTSANILNVKPDIYVLDNNSEIDPEINFNPKEYYKGNSYLFKLDQNYGYFGAVSEFLSRKQNLIFDWLFIANSDLIFNDSSLFDYLGECSEKWNGLVGAYCPAVISNRTRLDQNPFLETKPGLYYYYKYKAITFSFYLAKAHTALAMMKTKLKIFVASSKRKTQPVPQAIFAAHGAFVGLSKVFFIKGGFIESRNFLFHEEEILGILCNGLDLKIIYDSRVKISHDEHLTTGVEYNRWKHRIRRHSLTILKEYIK